LSIPQAIHKLHLRRKIAGHPIKVTIECTVVGELLKVSSPFWLLPENARRLTYGPKAKDISSILKGLIQNYRFLLPLLAVPEPVLPGNIKEEDQKLASEFRRLQKEFSYPQLKKLRSEIKDDWSRKLIYRAHHQAGIDFRRKLELIYEVSLLQKMNIYELVRELRIHDDEIFTNPLIKGLSRKNTTFRSFAIRWLQDNVTPEMDIQLVSALNSPDEWVKTSVIDLLEKMESKNVQKEISILMLKDPSVKVRSRAAFFLGNLPDSETVGELIKAVEDENWLVRQNALEALGKLSSEDAVAFLLDKLSEPTNTDKADIITSLGYHRFPGVAEQLIPFLKIGELKFITISALGKLGDPIALPPIRAISKKLTHPTRKRSVENVLTRLENKE
jgi:FOG: HEAT repeat